MNNRTIEKTAYVISMCLFLSALASASTSEIKINEITVLDSNFRVLRVIDNPDQLAKAQIQWKLLILIDALPNTNWSHKMDISSSSIGGRWLYNHEGYLAKLNKTLTPMYKVSNVKSFNEIYLGL